jgi:hypothetical protein
MPQWRTQCVQVHCTAAGHWGKQDRWRRQQQVRLAAAPTKAGRWKLRRLPGRRGIKSTWCLLAWPAPVQGAGQQQRPRVRHKQQQSQGSSAGALLRHLTYKSSQPAAITK